MRVFVTGASGFVGQHIVPLLVKEKHELLILHRRVTIKSSQHARIITVRGDLNDLIRVKKTIIRFNPQVCIHLAWEGIPDYGYAISQRNLINSTNFFHFLVTECGCRKIVAVGSCWEYGKDSGSCREDEPVGHGNYFVWAKRALCDFGLTLAKKENIAFVWLRLFYLYGPGQRSGSLIPTLTQAFKKEEYPEINAPLDANDFVDVADAAQALVKAAGNEVFSGIYNVGSGVSTPVWRVCELLEQASGKKTAYFKQLKASAPKVARDFWADTTKAREVLKWSVGTSLEQGIIKYLSFNEREDKA